MNAKVEYKCHNCGYAAVDDAHLRRHKNRKTPCIIRELTPGDMANPNRCTHCNKIMSTNGNLTKHLKTCKVKNGGPQLLHDKIKHEEQMRIWQEENKQKTNNIEKMYTALAEKTDMLLARIDSLETENNKLRACIVPVGNIITANCDVNITSNTNNTTDNTTDSTTKNINPSTFDTATNTTDNINPTTDITVNNYNRPNVEHLKDVPNFAKLLNRELSATPIALVELFWFDLNHPENISVHLIDEKTGEVLVSVEGKWVTDNAQNIIPAMRQIVYEFTQQMLVENPDTLVTFATDMVPAVLARNRNSENVIKMDSEDILQKLIDGRQVSQQQIDRFKQLHTL